ncbi:hypothetical protein AcV7_004711 [Taiwanofungus camphoratus]|nr:hypothetical protein AcV7_004711 [Antrodia cinnamomea]
MEWLWHDSKLSESPTVAFQVVLDASSGIEAMPKVLESSEGALRGLEGPGTYHHHTMLSFDQFTSDPITIDNGIGQGDMDSMILYAIYNFPLIMVPQGKDEDGGGFIDDTFYMAIADTFDDCDM